MTSRAVVTVTILVVLLAAGSEVGERNGLDIEATPGKVPRPNILYPLLVQRAQYGLGGAFHVWVSVLRHGG